MITRRDFMITTAATSSSPLELQAGVDQNGRIPLKAQPKARSLMAKLINDGQLLLFSDGPVAPPKLIKPATLEQAFGPGTDVILTQPDHWRMIEEGWFAEGDLYEPTDPDDPAFAVWQANYRPETEAHDLLYEIFRDRITGPFGTNIPELGLGSRPIDFGHLP